MKTLLLFALLCGAVLGENANKPSETRPSIDFSKTSTSVSRYSDLVIQTQPPTTVAMQVRQSSEPVFMLRGLPQNQGAFMPDYRRPEKPDQVVVEIWTQDGKKWVAKWEEAKK